MENCIIEGNAGYGLKSNNSVDIDFSTIVNNAKEGVSISSDSFSSINNSVIYFNDEQNFRQIESNSGILNLEYSNVQGLSNYGTSGPTQGAGNIESNPVFVDNMGRLSENSSCVDAASPWLSDMMMPPGLKLHWLIWELMEDRVMVYGLVAKKYLVVIQLFQIL